MVDNNALNDEELVKVSGGASSVSHCSNFYAGKYYKAKDFETSSSVAYIYSILMEKGVREHWHYRILYHIYVIDKDNRVISSDPSHFALPMGFATSYSYETVDVII